ncbi:hypothetical protein MKW98_013589, partial [Papaver atlanticum]
MDHVRVLKASEYTQFRVSPSVYYNQFFEYEDKEKTRVSTTSKKRKRKERKPYTLNERERSADQRHQPLLLKAHEVLFGAKDLLHCISNLKSNGGDDDGCCSNGIRELSCIEDGENNPLLSLEDYAMIFVPCVGYSGSSLGVSRLVPAFNNLVMNESCDDVEAEILNNRCVLPRNKCFYMLQSLTFDFICYIPCESYFFVVSRALHVLYLNVFTMWKSDLKRIHDLIH